MRFLKSFKNDRFSISQKHPSPISPVYRHCHPGIGMPSSPDCDGIREDVLRHSNTVDSSVTNVMDVGTRHLGAQCNFPDCLFIRAFLACADCEHDERSL